MSGEITVDGSAEIANDNAPVQQIPIVDFSAWKIKGDLSSRIQVAQEIVDACRKVGFVYIVNHTIPDFLIDEAFQWSKQFFALSDEDKMKAPHPDGWAVHRGYSWPDREKVSHITTEKDEDQRAKITEALEYKESYDMGSDKNGDQPNQWLPDEVLPGFRAFMTRFYWDCFSVTSDIMRALAVGIGLEDEDHLLKKHSGHNNQLRLLHYPEVPLEALERQTVSRMPAHSDWSSITILFQDDCGGLEAEDPSQPGRYIPAMPLKNAIVMNVGDLLQMWSNDYLRSTNHRVTIPPLSTSLKGSDRMTRERYSIPYFIAPDPTALIECLPACTSEENPPKHAPITQADYNRMRASMLY